jgi:hypothetical protein
MPSLACLSCLALAALASAGTLDRQGLVPRLRAADEVLDGDSAAGRQKIVCYDGPNQTGQSIVIDDYMPYIEGNMGNRIESCCFNGIWILYGEENYNRDDLTAHNFWAYGQDYNYCTNMPNGFKNEASSVRYSGHPSNMTKASINLYHSEYFMGDEEFAYENSPVLNYDNRAQSVIVTGDEWWTIYSGSNYQGYKACLAPGINGGPAFYLNKASLHSLGNDISSLAKGCWAEKRLEPDWPVVAARGLSAAAGFSQFH